MMSSYSRIRTSTKSFFLKRVRSRSSKRILISSISPLIFLSSCSQAFFYFSLNSFSFYSNSLNFWRSSSVISDSGLFIQSSRIYSDCKIFLSFFKLSSVPPSIVFKPRYPTLSPLRAASRSSSLFLFSSSSARSSLVKYFSTFISFSTSIVRICSGFSNTWLDGSKSVSYCFKL